MFNSRESSTEQGNSIELYKFTCGPNTWQWCNGDKQVTWRGKTYTPIAISNGGMTQSGDASNDETVVTLPSSTGLVEMLFADVPSIPVTMIMRKKHFDSTDAPIVMIAELANFGRDENADMAKLTFGILTGTFNRSGARMAWSRQCQHALYDRNCKVNPNDHKFMIEIDKIRGNRIESSDLKMHKAGKFDNGYIEWTNTYGITQRRAVDNNGGIYMTLYGRLGGLAEGMTIAVYRGCERTTKVCDNIFNNLPNYGGVNFMSGKSPFEGDPTW